MWYKRYNLKSIIVSLVIIVVGILLICLDVYWNPSDKSVWISIGCSLIASALVILLNVFLVESTTHSPLDEWGIEKIFETRAEKNKESDPKLFAAKHRIDVVAFGLKSFRNKHAGDIEECLKRGVNIRILTMDPKSEFVCQREKEENEVEGQIKKSIEDLIKWAKDLNKKSKKGKIKIKAYSCMTLDFYWRVDDELYVGPYWYGVGSQQTITYKFDKDKKGFKIYTDYFEKLWSQEDFIKLVK